MVDHILPKQNAKNEHQPAMFWRDVRAFAKAHVAEFKPGEAMRAALLLPALMAACSGEVRGAACDKFDLETSAWTIPGEWIKEKEAHRVVLSKSAFAVARSLKEQKLPEMLVFPSPRGKVLSDIVLKSFLRRVKAQSDIPGRMATTHGFVGNFRD